MNEAPKPYSVYNDPGYQALRNELKYAALRIGANLLISGGDALPSAIPVLGQGGEGVSIAADATKLVRLTIKVVGLKWKFDLTPDVDWSALVLEPVDWAAGTLTPFPSHVLETSLQIKHDAQRLWRFYQIHRMDKKGITHEEMRDFLYEASKKDRIFEDLRPKPPVILSDLSTEEILRDHVPRPFI